MKVLSISGIVGALVLVGAVGFTALAVADDFDPIAARRALMKQDGQNSKQLFDMAQGTVPFDAAKAVAAATVVAGAGHTFATEFDKYFPDSSKTGDTKSTPALWDNKDDVKKRFADLETDAKAIVAAAPNGADAFKAAFGKLGGDCGGCHEKYKMR
jgi:cytochrome c556